MFRKGTSGLERLKQIEYLKTKIREAFDIMTGQHDSEGQLKKEEVSSVMRYLGRFPSEAQIVQTILPEIQEDEPPNNVTYEKFEPFILKCIMDNEYEPDDAETLLACFRVLDTEKKGYIDASAMQELTMNQGITFFQEVWDKFYNEEFDHEAKVIHYEEYIARLILENEKHMEYLMKDYETFQYPYLASEPNEMRKDIKQAYFGLWKFKLLKQRLINLILLLRPRKRDSTVDEMKAALRIISIKSDVSDVLTDWERQSHLLPQEFEGGVTAVEEYLEAMQFPFPLRRSDARKVDEEKMTLVFNPGLKGYEFHVEDDIVTAREDEGSVSWQTAYEEEQ